VQLERVQAENDILVAKHSKHAQELQDELINLPSTADVSKKLDSCCYCIWNVFSSEIWNSPVWV